MAYMKKITVSGEDTFELHSVQVELEAVEKQIRDLVERQAQLRAALETSRADTQKSGARCTQDSIFPDVLHSGDGTPRTLGATGIYTSFSLDSEHPRRDDSNPSEDLR